MYRNRSLSVGSHVITNNCNYSISCYITLSCKGPEWWTEHRPELVGQIQTSISTVVCDGVYLILWYFMCFSQHTTNITLQNNTFFFLMATNRILWKTWYINLYYLQWWQHARVRNHVSPCGDCGGRSGKEGSSFYEYSTNTPYSSSFSKLDLTGQTGKIWKNSTTSTEKEEYSRLHLYRHETACVVINGRCSYWAV